MKRKMVIGMLTMGMVLCGAMTVSAESDGYVISASHGYGAVEHWEIKTIGMQDAAKDLGVEFNYKYADGDLQQEVADIENFVEMGTNYIIVGPCNSEGIVPVIEEAQDKGVAVGTCDIGIEGVDVASFVSSDNYGIGEIAADYIGTEMNGEGEIAILTWPAASATADRAKGFKDKMEEKYPNIIFILDYKLASSNMTHLMKLDNLNYVTNKDVYKFVLGSDEDLQEAYELITKFNLTNKCLVYFSPVFSAIKLEDIVEFMKEKNLNKVRLQVQLHKVIWDPNMKGV